MSKEIRVGLIGYGFSGKTFHAPLIQAEKRLSLTLVASSDAQKVHADMPGMAVRTDPLSVATAANIDLVVIATPNASHEPLARAALDAGKHVIVDKPFTLDLAQARGLIEMSKARAVMLSVFHNRRWDSDFLSVRQAIKEGLIGTVSHFESHFDRYRPQVRDRWREGGGPGSGVWFDLGPHLIDQALQLFGLPDRVQSNFARQRAGAMDDDWAHVVLSYGERRAVLHAGMLVAGGTNRFIVHGDTGTVVKRKPDRQEQQLIGGMRPGDFGWGEDADPLLVFDRTGEQRTIPATAGDQRRYYAGIVDALNGPASDIVTPVQALAVMAVIEAALDSNRSHRSVELALTAPERASFSGFTSQVAPQPPAGRDVTW